jgi:hypothetical protein
LFDHPLVVFINFSEVNLSVQIWVIRCKYAFIASSAGVPFAIEVVGFVFAIDATLP